MHNLTMPWQGISKWRWLLFIGQLEIEFALLDKSAKMWHLGGVLNRG